MRLPGMCTKLVGNCLTQKCGSNLGQSYEIIGLNVQTANVKSSEALNFLTWMLTSTVKSVFCVVNMSERVKMAGAFTCAANTSTTVHDHRGPPGRPRPTGAETLDGSRPRLKDMLAEVQHG